MAKIEIYTKAFCPYCPRAKSVFDRRGLMYQEYDITMDSAKRSEMIARADGRTTVPQVFVGGHHVGGSDDLAAADRSGELDALLAAAR